MGLVALITGFSPVLMGVQSCQNAKVSSESALGTGACGRVPASEAATLLGRWWAVRSGQPLPVSIARPSSGAGQMTVSAFSTPQITAILDALDQWNQFFRTQVPDMGGQNWFDYGTRAAVRSSSALPVPPGVCPSSIVSAGVINGTVSFFNVSANWQAGSGVIALTTYCTVSEGYARRSITGAQITFNSQDYGDAGGSKPAPDWPTIARHEAGHLLGQDHVNSAGSLMQPNLMGGGIAQVLPIDAGTQNRTACLYSE